MSSPNTVEIGVARRHNGIALHPSIVSVDSVGNGLLDQTFEPPERLREQLRAETLLAKMDAFERFAVGAFEDSASSPGTPKATIWDHKTSETYRRAIGVAPSQRERLRDKLEKIAIHAHRQVADLIEEIAGDAPRE